MYLSKHVGINPSGNVLYANELNRHVFPTPPFPTTTSLIYLVGAGEGVFRGTVVHRLLASELFRASSVTLSKPDL